MGEGGQRLDELAGRLQLLQTTGLNWEREGLDY